MPLLICLKEPAIHLIVDGEIKDTPEATKEWDDMFNNQILMTKRVGGLNMVIPLLRDCNIAYMQEVTEEEIEKQKKEAKERMEQMQKQGGGGGMLTKPGLLFPSGRGGHG